MEDLLGDDDVFEVDRNSLASRGTCQLGAPLTVTVDGSGSLLAPLCFMDPDSDLDWCPSPLSERNGTLSPYSLSGDWCRWVTVWMV